MFFFIETNNLDFPTKKMYFIFKRSLTIFKEWSSLKVINKVSLLTVVNKGLLFNSRQQSLIKVRSKNYRF